MGKRLSPRKGSMQFWPRKRAGNVLVRVRTWAKSSNAGPLCFVGYKAGMAHIIGAKGKTAEACSVPVTLVECPPAKIFSVRFYKQNVLKTEILAPKFDKFAGRALVLPKDYSKTIDGVKVDYDGIRILAYSLTNLIGIGKKKPDVFEVALGGSKDAQLAWVKENLEKEIHVKDVFKENAQVDVHAVTKGHGYQGPAKRFGINLRQHKSEKGVRRVGSRSGGWSGHAHMMYRVPQPGKMGYHARTEYNKIIIRICGTPENPKGGFKNYGLIKNEYIIVRGSLPGPSKRAVKFTPAIRPNHRLNLAQIKYGQVYYES